MATALGGRRAPGVVVALDLAEPERALALARRLAGSAVGFKVGLELYAAAGPAVLDRLRDLTDATLVLDAKLCDIPRTVLRTTRLLSAHGVDLVTAHALGGRRMLEAAAAGLAEGAAAFGRPAPGVLAVTVLSHLTSEEVRQELALRDAAASDAAARLARLARDSGAAGCVCAGPELAQVRRAVPDPAFRILVPGVRFGGQSAAGDDQRRRISPAQAAADGASLLVAGRIVTEAPDPEAALAQFLAEAGGGAGS